MTLEEAIKHAEEKAEEHSRCGEDHAQLAMWLKELQTRRMRGVPCSGCAFCFTGKEVCLRCPAEPVEIR